MCSFVQILQWEGGSDKLTQEQVWNTKYKITSLSF
mgnify:CR=1 FL=1